MGLRGRLHGKLVEEMGACLMKMGRGMEDHRSNVCAVEHWPPMAIHAAQHTHTGQCLNTAEEADKQYS